jgi:hypothetical protein
MIGVKFNRAMRPFGVGDTALLPDSVGQAMINEGAAVRHEFPSLPHSSDSQTTASPAKPEAGDGAGKSKPATPRRQTYLTK